MSLNFRITGLEELQRDLKEAARAALASSFCSMELKHFATYCIVYARIAFLITKWRTCKMKNFSRETRLVSRPNGAATHSNFEIAEVELSPLGSGEIRVRNTWMSVDPYMRGRMRDYESYLPPFQIGKVLEGMAVGEVVESNDPGFATGDTVMSMMGWREAIVPDIPSVAVRLLLKKSEHEYGDLDTIRSYRSVVEKTYEYDNVEKVVASIEENIIFPAEAKVQELRRRS